MAFGGIKKYLDFFKSDKKSIDDICEKYGIKNYSIGDNGLIDVNRCVDLNGKSLTKLPLKFNSVSVYFTCSSNKLTSLEGCPKYVGGYFGCEYNKLTSLKGCPKYVGGIFGCSDNKLTSLEGFPEDYNGEVRIDNNPVYEIIKLFPRSRYDKSIYWLNEFEVIRYGKKIVLDRLEEVFIQMELEVPNSLKFNNYEII